MVAVPAELVNAVPPVGFIVANVALVLNVITVFCTAAPVASFKVAVTVVGASVEIEVVVPPALVRASVRVGAATVVVAGTDEAAADEAAAPPPPQPVSMAAEAANNNGNENLAITLLEKIFNT